MRLVEPVLVTVFESEIPILLVTGSLLLEILLSHHVQRRGRGQLCVAWRLLSRFLANPIRLTFFRCAAMLWAMRVEGRHTPHDKRDHCHHHKKPHRFKFPGHKLGLPNHTRFLRARPILKPLRPEIGLSPDLRCEKQSLTVFRLDGRR